MRVDDADLLLEAETRRKASAAAIRRALELCAESGDILALVTRNGLVRPAAHRPR